MGAFVDAEGAVAAFFRPMVEAAGGRSVTEVPNPRPPVLVRSWRTGGAAVNRRLDAPIITTQVWHSTKVGAAELAGRIRDDLHARWGRRLQEVSGVYYDPDPASEAHRYTFATQLWLPSHI